MALISCPECGREISNKVNACPHCGYPFSEINQEQSAPQQVEVTSVNLKPNDPKTIKKILLGGAVAVVAIIAIVVAVFAVNQHNAETARNEYIENLKLVRAHMLSGGSIAEQMCNLTKSVWYNTIYEERDSATNAYTMTDGKFNEDFNDSLRSLYADSNVVTIVDGLEENRETVSNLMRELQSPPDGLESCYHTVESMYDAYHGLTGLAISPTGSLKTYSEDFRTYDSDFMKYYEKLDTQIPEQ